MKGFFLSFGIFLISNCILPGIQAQSKYLFPDLPDSLNVSEEELSVLFKSAPGTMVSLSVSGRYQVKGTIRSSVQKYDELKSLMIECSNYPGAFISLARRTDGAENTEYAGRILGSGFSDGYELRKTGEGKYYLLKIEVNSAFR